MRCCALTIFAPLVLAGCFCAKTAAQESVAALSHNVLTGKIATTKALAIGVITDRLTPKDLQRWNSIERIVFAQNVEGQYLHPTLCGLWQWIETSGHAVYIEFAKPTINITSTAGHFSIAALDPSGERHEGVIRLNLANIDMAYVGQETWRALGFIPFDQLSREDRYVEVLGHEMAHAADILTSLDKTNRVDEMVEKTNEMLMHHRSLKPMEQLTIELKHRLNRRDAMLKVLESAAEKMESAVWRELVASKPLREKNGNLARKQP